MFRSITITVIILLVMGISVTGCNFPRDPENTLSQVSQGTMRVGAIENEPWVIRHNEQPSGVEVELVQALAEQLDAEIEWVWGNEQEHMEALERFELDLVIGGLTQSTPWQNRVGLTQPYFETRVMIGLPDPEAVLRDLTGLRIAVKPGTVAAAQIEEEEAIPIRVETLTAFAGPVAAPEWQLELWGYKVTEVELTEEKYVMAVPPGENGWLMRVDQFLQQQQPRIRDMLQRVEQL